MAKEYTNLALVSCELRLRGPISGPILQSRSEASKRLLALKNQGPSEERQKLERRLQEDAFFRGRVDEIVQGILPRLGEILRQLLQCSQPICLPSKVPGFLQLAVRVICAGILSEKLAGAKQYLVYVDGMQQTTNVQEFAEWQRLKVVQKEAYGRALARDLRLEAPNKEVAELKKELKTKCGDRRDSPRFKDPELKKPDVNLQKIKKLEENQAFNLQKIAELEKQRAVDNKKITELIDERVNFEGDVSVIVVYRSVVF